MPSPAFYPEEGSVSLLFILSFSLSFFFSFLFFPSFITSMAFGILGFYRVPDFWLSATPSSGPPCLFAPQDTALVFFFCLLVPGLSGTSDRGHFQSKLPSEFLCRSHAFVRNAAVPAQPCSVNNLLPGKWELNEPAGISYVNFGVSLTAI